MATDTIALIGMPGVGKSTVGKMLARKTGRRFIDTDREIEKKAGRSIPEIFAQNGEAAFRILERLAVARAMETQGAVISCGGGVVLFPQNVQMLRRGTVVYLSATVQTLTRHVHGGKGRPLLAGDARQRVEKLLAEREAAYLAAADIVVHTDGKTVADVVHDVECALSEKQNT